jgi:hypothetical protein
MMGELSLAYCTRVRGGHRVSRNWMNCFVSLSGFWILPAIRPIGSSSSIAVEASGLGLAMMDVLTPESDVQMVDLVHT